MNHQKDASVYQKRHNLKKCLSGCGLLIAALTLITTNENIYLLLASFLESSYSLVTEGFGFWSFVWSIIQIPLSAITYIIAPVIYFFLILSIKTYWISNISLIAIFICLSEYYKSQKTIRMNNFKDSDFCKDYKTHEHFGEIKNDVIFKLKDKAKAPLPIIFIIIISLFPPIAFTLFSSNAIHESNLLTISGASNEIYEVVSSFFNVGYFDKKEIYAIHITTILFCLLLCTAIAFISIISRKDKNYIIQIEGKNSSEVKKQVTDYFKNDAL